jgi:hypothetical protein
MKPLAPAAPRQPTATTATTAAPPPTKAPPRAPDPSASILVLDATRLLRVERDPRRALVLLGEYRRRFPHGDLLEECLALTIEARTMLGDREAGALAREYLAMFPAGRFRDEALRAERRFAP